MSSPTAVTTGGAIVCPFVAAFDADSRLNITSNVNEQVTINNIDHQIDVSAADLKTAFNCDGWGINKLLAENQLLVSELVVSLPDSGSALKGILSAAVTDGQLKTYLEGQYETAFDLAFPDYANESNKDLSGDSSTVPDSGNTTISGDMSGNGGVSDPGNATLSASLVVQTARVSSYSFAIDICGGEAAANMYAGLNQTSRLNSLFLQLPYATNIVPHVDNSGNKTDSNLPLNSGDSITFVFDISVTASTDPNTSSATDSTPNGVAGTDAPATNNGAADHSISMDLGSRRVAFKIPQSA
jgi:hypothetical protein